MIQRIFFRFSLLAMIVLVIVSVTYAVAASNTVSNSRLTNQTKSATLAQLTPAACAGLPLTAILVCGPGNNCNGTTANELILGAPATKNIRGGGGADCIVASTAANTICHTVSGQEIFINCGKIV